MGPDSTPNQRTGENVQDWYAVLGLSPNAELKDIDAAIEQKSRQASAIANTSPDRSQQIRDMIRAIRADLLSGAEKRQEYNERRTRSRQPVTPPPPPPTIRSVEPMQRPASAAPAGSSPAPLAATANAAASEVGRMASRFRQFLQTGWTCPSCHAEGMPEDKFCKKCGATMKTETVKSTTQCPKCSAEIGANNKFCSRCGASAL